MIVLWSFRSRWRSFFLIICVHSITDVTMEKKLNPPLLPKQKQLCHHGPQCYYIGNPKWVHRSCNFIKNKFDLYCLGRFTKLFSQNILNNQVTIQFYIKWVNYKFCVLHHNEIRNIRSVIKRLDVKNDLLLYLL